MRIALRMRNTDTEEHERLIVPRSRQGQLTGRFADDHAPASNLDSLQEDLPIHALKVIDLRFPYGRHLAAYSHWSDQLLLNVDSEESGHVHIFYGHTFTTVSAVTIADIRKNT